MGSRVTQTFARPLDSHMDPPTIHMPDDRNKILVFIGNLLANKVTCVKRVIEMDHVSSLTRHESGLILELKPTKTKRQRKL